MKYKKQVIFLDSTGWNQYNSHTVIHHPMPLPENQKEKEEALETIEEEALPEKIGVTGKEIAFLVVILVLVSVLVVFFLARVKEKDRAPSIKIVTAGDRAPAFRLPTTEGRFVNLSDHRGKVVMIHFWATWCPPCVDEMPELEALHRQLKGKDFELLAISVDEGGPGIVTAFMKKHGISYPVLLDPARSISGLYGTFKFPETYIIDRDGVVAYKAIGSREWTTPVNMNIVKNIMDQR